jgi:outer membrane receptor protein involved in Fe transport
LAPHVATAQTANDAADAKPGDSEIVVTATRREGSVIDVPYNISVVGGSDLAARGIDSVSKLAQSIPGLNFADRGTGYANAVGQSFVLRGINATNSFQVPVTSQGQPPVALYYGDTPLFTYFPLKDVSRIEVLRGPQGTLFGAGALAGAVRVIPNAPELGKTYGKLQASTATVAESKKFDYAGEAVLNLALGENAALRIVGGYERQAGFIDELALYKRTSTAPLAPVVQVGNLASAPVIERKNDANDQRTTYVRASLRFEPTDALKVTASYGWFRSDADSQAQDNPYYNGGPFKSFAQPAPPIVLPNPGNYESVASALQPSHVQTHLAALDVEVDLGFATLTSNSAYYHTSTENYVSSPSQDIQSFGSYYQGVPRYPGFVPVYSFLAKNKGVSEEARLVSNGDGPFKWIIGGFYSDQTSDQSWDIYSLGLRAWKAFSGSPTPFAFVRDEITFDLTRQFKVEDIAGFGELTYAFSPSFEITGGFRAYKTRSRSVFDTALVAYDPQYAFVNTTRSNTSDSGVLFKANAVYKLSRDHRLYATFSQGFRRGGSNAFSLTGLYPEPAALLQFKPDKVDNYEIGLKGRLGRLTYTVAAFYDKIKDTQIETTTPVNGWPVLVNGGDSESKGIELELSGRLTDNLSIQIGYAYADAKFTEDYTVPTLYPGISGKKGDQLPGSAKHNFGASLSYDRPINDHVSVSGTVSGNYRSFTLFGPPAAAGNPYQNGFGGYALFNATLGVKVDKISATLYVDNLTNKRVEYGRLNLDPAGFPGLDVERAFQTAINRPRTIGLRLGYAF